MTASGTSPRRVVIMGAAGRDFHNFNVVYRDDAAFEVVAFTAAQIPGISGRTYPPRLAGERYPAGIPVLSEDDLASIVREQGVHEVVFAYSDVEHAFVMHKASIAIAAGADFTLLGTRRTMLVSRRPVIAISAVRTGVGKSQTTRWLSGLMRARGLKTAVIRHPMPYGDLKRQAVQRFATLEEIDAGGCSIEEREEYEPHVAAGGVVYAGIDYARILALAEEQAEVILWDGGNNDFPFIRPDLHIVLVDPLRPGHETTHHPGEAVLRMADIVVAAKCNSAAEADIERVIESARALAPEAAVVRANSRVRLDDPEAVAGRRVLVVEDGPTITHGGMAYGAGYVAAIESGASDIVDPRGTAAGRLAEVYRAYPHIGRVIPAMGYFDEQIADLASTINRSDADVVVAGTPFDLGHLIRVDKPVVRARYDFEEAGDPSLGALVLAFLQERGLGARRTAAEGCGMATDGTASPAADRGHR